MFRFLLAALSCLTIAWADPVLVAHRGASADAPENTLPAFKLAWEQGADAIEGDFRLTNDGHIVCIHDDTTKRTGDCELNVSKSSLTQLRSIDVGSWKSAPWKDTRIPTLPEILAIIPVSGTLFLEVKCGPEIIPPLLAQLENCSLRSDQVTVISFNAEVIRAFKKAAPEHKAFWLCSLKPKTDGADYDSTFATLASIKADALSTNACKDIDEGFLARLRECGCAHHVWTVNDAPTARRFLALGTSSVTTDRPGALRKELNR